MLRHIVMVVFKAEATEEQRSAFRTACEALISVPDVEHLTGGVNVGSGPNHHDYAVVMDFADMAAFRRYIESAEHKAYVSEYAGIIEKLSAIQHTW